MTLTTRLYDSMIKFPSDSEAAEFAKDNNLDYSCIQLRGDYYYIPRSLVACNDKLKPKLTKPRKTSVASRLGEYTGTAYIIQLVDGRYDTGVATHPFSNYYSEARVIFTLADAKSMVRYGRSDRRVKKVHIILGKITKVY